MTRAELLKIVRDNSQPGDWGYVTEVSTGTLRPVLHKHTGECPICFVGRLLDKNPMKYILHAVDVGERLGMSDGDINDVMHSADRTDGPHRADVLAACHITETLSA